MSRCFPYPPPGYQVNRCGRGNEALIESIKLQREREQANAERKREKKREKKEKRKEKKAKKDKANQNIDNFFCDEKNIKKIERCRAVLKDVREEDSEQLERSTLTEEHDQPICLHNPSSSSDNTQHSNKRKRHASPPAVVQREENISRGPGNIIRIRLSSQRKQDDTAICREEPCSTSGRVHLPAQRKHQIASVAGQEKPSPRPQGTNDVVKVPLLVPDGEQICSTSGKSEAVIGEDISIFGNKKPDKKLQRMEQQYNDLIEDWVLPSSFQTQLDFGDEDWLVKRKRPLNHIDEKLKSSKDVSCSSSSVSSLWPRAHFLPDAEIYALPFTVPF